MSALRGFLIVSATFRLWVRVWVNGSFGSGEHFRLVRRGPQFWMQKKSRSATWLRLWPVELVT